MHERRSRPLSQRDMIVIMHAAHHCLFDALHANGQPSLMISSGKCIIAREHRRREQNKTTQITKNFAFFTPTNCELESQGWLPYSRLSDDSIQKGGNAHTRARAPYVKTHWRNTRLGT